MVRTQASDASDQKVLDDIRQFGWHLVGIDADDEGPDYVFSVGIFHTFGHPEIVIFGLNSMDMMFQIVNAIGEAIRNGARFEDWYASDEFLENYSCIFRQVDRSFYRDYLGYALWFCESDNFPVLQCVWPDMQHRYPWDDGFPEKLWERQPVLARGDSWPFRMAKNTAVFTTRPVIEANYPIMRVTHDADGNWQFLCGTTNRTSDGKVVSFAYIVGRDPTLAQLTDLPVGWTAVREAPDRPWRRMKAD